MGITPAITFFFMNKPQYNFWFSNHTFIILGIALLLKSKFWVMAELCLGTIPELYWSTDFLFRIITGKFLFGTTEYMFKNNAFNIAHIYSLQHLLFVPLGLLALHWLGGPAKKAWIGSIGHASILLIISKFFPEYNINCTIHSCIPIKIPYYQIIWPIIIVLNIMLMYFILTSIWNKKEKRRRPEFHKPRILNFF